MQLLPVFQNPIRGERTRDAKVCDLGASDTIGRCEYVACLLAPAVLVLAAIGAQYSFADLWISSFFYDKEIKAWPLRDHWMVRGVLHDGAQLIVKLFGAGLLLLIAAKFVLSKGKRFPKSLGIAFLAMAIGPLAVGYLKSVTHLACPWDEVIFGGAAPHLRLFDSVPAGTSVGRGFPSAHASGGYAFVALYFAASRLRFKALLLGIGLGLVFGIAQQARGAHFLSHDLIALAICWTGAGAVYSAFRLGPMSQFLKTG